MEKTAFCKSLIRLIFFLLTLLLLSCHVFLGPEPKNSQMKIFNQLWLDFDRSYALFNERLEGKTWKDVREEYSAQITPDMNNFDFFGVCAKMINTMNDSHVSLSAPFNHSTYYISGPYGGKEFILEGIQEELKNGGKLAGNKMFLYGTFKSKPHAGYLYIKNFIDNSGIGINIIQDWAKEIEKIVKELQKTTDFLILDIRNNDGGFSINMEYIAGHFVSVQRDYLKVRTKNGPAANDFSSPFAYAIKPADIRYTKPIVLLTNNDTVSAAEWFTMALLTQNNVTQTGEKTRGALSTRLDRQLRNGWIYSLSIQKVSGVDGKQVEGIGISPNKEHTIYNPITEYFYGWDTQLRHALDMF
ncbi:MAG: S41 family peptidase [Treponema sp.]|nr:S41 family peptidase [Treponema sp.]